MPLCQVITEVISTADRYGRFVRGQPATLVVIILQRSKNEDVIFISNVSKLNRRTANSQTLLI